MADHTIIFGEALEVLRSLPAESADVCVTSPPYYGLRSYSDDPRELGKEATPGEYVERLVAVFREVKRVLKPEATLWLVLGDSYAGSSMQGGPASSSTLHGGHHRERTGTGEWSKGRKYPGLKPKDLMLMPARVALALQADGAADPVAMQILNRMMNALTSSYETEDEWPAPVRREIASLKEEYSQAAEGGWWLRNDIIWAKPNAMPESCKDRFSSKHEHVFLLAKQGTYWFDLDVVREALSAKTISNQRWTQQSDKRAPDEAYPEGTNHQTGFDDYSAVLGKNPGDVWTIPTQPTPYAHFATFPEALVERCLKAGCPPKVCAECGKAYEHRMERTKAAKEHPAWRPKESQAHSSRFAKVSGHSGQFATAEYADLGYHPACYCGTEHPIPQEELDADPSLLDDFEIELAPTIPGLVLDPFAGSGTVTQVARRMGLRSIGIELQAEYETVMLERFGRPKPQKGQGALDVDAPLADWLEFVTHEA